MHLGNDKRALELAGRRAVVLVIALAASIPAGRGQTHMTKSSIVSLGVATALLCSVSASFAADKTSEKFITMAIQGNLAETSMGQLAQQKGQSDSVKSFGQQLMKDH